MKSYTSLEQSRTLAEILPLESADMHYIIMGNDEDPQSVVGLGEYIGLLPTIPCWSLAALFCIIPKRIKDFVILRIDIDDNDFAIWYDEIGCGANEDLPDVTMKEPVDACCAMILKLHEQKYL